MKYTENLNLKKPEQSDYINVEDFNDNADTIDLEVGKIKSGTTKVKSAESADKALDADKLGGKTPSHYATKIEVDKKADKDYVNEVIGDIEVPVTSVNNKTGAVVLNAGDVGAETPAGAQEKANTAANTALGAAKDYTDQKSIENASALNELQSDLESHKSDDMTKAGGTFTGIVAAHSNTSYTVRQVRNIILSPNDASVDSMQDGDIWIKYK